MKILVVLRDLTFPDIKDDEIAQIESASKGAEVVVAASDGEALEHCIDSDIVLGIVERDWFRRAEKLRWMHAVAAGMDSVLFPELKASDVIVTGEKGLVGEHLSDHAFALLLGLTRQLKQPILEGRDMWRLRLPLRRKSLELRGRTAGIVGLGGVGRAVAERAKAFGMEVIAVDKEDVPAHPAVGKIWRTDEFEGFLQSADTFFVCCPLTPDTLKLFGKKQFAMMPADSLIVNVSRGKIIDDVALVEALESGHLGGAGLDVVPTEPLPSDNALWDLPNVIMTPHTAGGSPMRARRNVQRFVTNLGHFLAGEPLEGVVDKQKGY